MIVDLKNGKRSDKMGCKTNYPQHSVFDMNNKIRVIRVREYNYHGISGIMLLNKDRVTVCTFNIYNHGDWKEYQLEEGEVITGVFG